MYLWKGPSNDCNFFGRMAQWHWCHGECDPRRKRLSYDPDRWPEGSDVGTSQYQARSGTKRALSAFTIDGETVDHCAVLQDTKRDCISKKTITEFLERLALYEKWVLKSLLGPNHTVRVAAVNVKVIVRKNNVKPETHFGDLYVVQNTKNGTVSFKLYSPKDNKFIWTIDTVSTLDGYVDLKCNTHILHLGDSVYTFKFPDKKERTLFRDNLNKFLFFEKSKR